MTTTLYVIEYAVGTRLCRKALPTKSAALAWARERVRDADDGTICAVVRCYRSGERALDALATATEGRDWFDERVTIATVIKPGTRITR